MLHLVYYIYTKIITNTFIIFIIYLLYNYFNFVLKSCYYISFLNTALVKIVINNYFKYSFLI